MKFVPRLSPACGIEVPIVRVLLAWEGEMAGRQANATLAPTSARKRARSRGPEDVTAVSIARICEERARRAGVPCRGGSWNCSPVFRACLPGYRLSAAEGPAPRSSPRRGFATGNAAP